MKKKTIISLLMVFLLLTGCGNTAAPNKLETVEPASVAVVEETVSEPPEEQAGEEAAEADPFAAVEAEPAVEVQETTFSVDSPTDSTEKSTYGADTGTKSAEKTTYGAGTSTYSAGQTEQKPVAPSPEPTPTPVAISYSYGGIPFDLAASTGTWWQIDSTDSAYWAVQENINAMRAAGGLPALTMDSGLSSIADARCRSFVEGGAFDHSGMVTKSEICASGPLGSASSVCSAWQGSSNHYSNIMRTDISRMGVGCWFCQENGSQYTYWTVTFE